MIWFLADVPAGGPSFSAVMQWVLLITSVLANVALLLALRSKKETRIIEPNPLTIRMAEQFVTKEHCEMEHRNINGRCQALEAGLKELKEQREQDREASSESRRRIYEEIEGVREGMGEMERRLNAADEARTKEVHNRLNDILDAVAELRGKTSK